MRDGWDESFIPSSPYSYEALRWQRYAHQRPLVSGKVLLISVAVLVLLGFIWADVALAESQPATVRVTGVEWLASGTILASTAGFSMHSSEKVTLSLTCSTTCLRIQGASVAAPFTMVSFSVVYAPDQYTNVTVESPSTSYAGPIAIELNVG